MKYARLFGILILLTVFSMPILGQDVTKSEKASRAVISFGAVYHNFGSVSNDTTLTYRFVFRNSGKDTLRIYRLKSG